MCYSVHYRVGYPYNLKKMLQENNNINTQICCMIKNNTVIENFSNHLRVSAYCYRNGHTDYDFGKGLSIIDYYSPVLINYCCGTSM